MRVRALSCVLMRCVWLGYLPVRLSPRCCGHRKEGLGCCLLRMSPVRCGGCGPLAFQTIGDHYLPEREKVRMVIKIVRLAATRPRSIRSTRMERTFFFFPPSLFSDPARFPDPMSGNESPPFAATFPSPDPLSYPPVTSHPNRPYIFRTVRPRKRPPLFQIFMSRFNSRAAPCRVIQRRSPSAPLGPSRRRSATLGQTRPNSAPQPTKPLARQGDGRALNRYHRGMRRHNRHKGAPIKRQLASLSLLSLPSLASRSTFFPDAAHKREQTPDRISRLNGSHDAVRSDAFASRLYLASRSLSFPPSSTNDSKRSLEFSKG